MSDNQQLSFNGLMDIYTTTLRMLGPAATSAIWSLSGGKRT